MLWQRLKKIKKENDMLTKEQALDILTRFEFFHGQRAGRELWFDKPLEVQEQDLNNFARDVSLLKEYVYNVAPGTEGEWVATCEAHPLVNKYTCSCCGKDSMQGNFCPHCGAKMKRVS
jgi:hypothetical protein